MESHQKIKDYLLECYQNNQDEHHQLQKLVDNGKQWDHDEEAKLNKLVAVHLEKKEYPSERYATNQTFILAQEQESREANQDNLAKL